MEILYDRELIIQCPKIKSRCLEFLIPLIMNQKKIGIYMATFIIQGQWLRSLRSKIIWNYPSPWAIHSLFYTIKISLQMPWKKIDPLNNFSKISWESGDQLSYFKNDNWKARDQKFICTLSAPCSIIVTLDPVEVVIKLDIISSDWSASSSIIPMIFETTLINP